MMRHGVTSMEPFDLEELLVQARQIGSAVRRAYRDVTGEDLDIESAVRHYPVIALGAAVGAGTLAGWWLGRRGHSQPQLPPPPPEPARGILDSIESTLPGAIDRVRGRLPEIVVSDAVKARAKLWMTSVFEDHVLQNLDAAVEKTDTRLSNIFRKATERLEPGHDVHLDDPNETP